MQARGYLYAPLVLALLAASGVASAQQAEERDFMMRVREASPASRAPSDGAAEGRLGSQQMRRANRVASELLRRNMAGSRQDDLELLERARQAEVIVLRGQYDRVQDVLTALGVNHVVIPPGLLSRQPLMSTQTVMVNCPGYVGSAATERVQRFVETGGFLVTTDWALAVVARGFPETIRRGGPATADDVVDVDEVMGDHPFLEHVRTTDDNLHWWLEGASYPIRVLDPRRVEVLLSSTEMGRKYREPTIAATFRAGEGRVLHTTSHFYLQQARLSSQRDRAGASAFARDLGLDDRTVQDLRGRGLDQARVGEVVGAYAMQQLIANVIVEKRRANDALLSSFSLRAKATAALRPVPGPTEESVGEVHEDFLLRELERRGSEVRVRDLFGREGWIDASLVEARNPPPAEPVGNADPPAVAPTDPIDMTAAAAILPVQGSGRAATSACAASGTAGSRVAWLGLLVALLGIRLRRSFRTPLRGPRRW